MLSVFCLEVYIFAVVITSLGHSSLHAKFSYYEILTTSHISIRVKRYSDGRKTPHKELSLSVFGRKVSLSIKSGLPPSLLSPDANLHAIHANGTKSRIDLDPGDFHQGVIKGHPGSRVNSFYHEGLWTIQAVHPVFSFSVEPLSYHTGFESNQKMLAYRHEDVRIGNETAKPFCQHYQLDNHKHSSLFPEYKKFTDKIAKHFSNLDSNNVNHSKYNRNEDTTSSARTKRDSTATRTNAPKDSKGREEMYLKPHVVCDILALVDYSFFDGVGRGSVMLASKLVINAYAAANDMIASTKFQSVGKVGLQLRGLELYTFPGQLLPISNPDAENDGINAIRALKKNPDFVHFCLVHVTSQILFKGQTLGLALTATGSRFGICGSQYFDYSLNVGISTIVHQGRTLSYSTYTYVLTHEIGHGFGSSHDDYESDPPECHPDEADGGKYLMWYHTNKGYSRNNRKFSPCSIKDIDKILKERSACLIPKDIIDRNTCGNGFLDYGEDCDSGRLVSVGSEGDCCNDKCRFRRHAMCSSYNHACCKNCSVAPSSQRCFGDLDYSCSEDAYCDGLNFNECPLPRSKPNGYKCVHSGECNNGICIDYCALLGQTKQPIERLARCDCDKDQDAMCFICCKKIDASDASCEKTDKRYEDGTPCMLGFCVGGSCRESNSMDIVGWKTDPNVRKRNQAYFLNLAAAMSMVIFLTTCSIIFICNHVKQRRLQQNAAQHQEVEKI